MSKIALVTGGSRGIGKDIALSLAKKGMDVVITYHSNKESAEKVIEEIKALGQKSAMLVFDASIPSSIDSFIVEFKNVLNQIWDTDTFDFLINNAGIGATIPISDVSFEDFDKLMNIHYKSVYFLTQKCIPLLRDNAGIINISSGTTRFSIPGYSVYASLKSAIETLTKYQAKELGNKGIRANVVAPGPVETDFNNAAIRNNPQVKSYLSGLSPLGRVGYADDIGSVVSFLCSDDAKWINGQRIEVSGGINL